ncbi:MAG: AAA family ATPase [Muribaculaceae bacterium]|nr:AAA family ATPase [Muribaculaceae bacterium]
MERIYEISQRLIQKTDFPYHRYLYDKIAWTDPLIMLKGARGVGKTTLMLQRCKEIPTTSVYASLDQLWFNDHSIIELADYHYKHGGTHIFLDEVHLYPGSNWEQEIKNIYDSYPGLNLVFTGSSLLHLNSKSADLSRRVVEYELRGLSFREYLNFSGSVDFSSFSLDDILTRHAEIARSVTSKIKVIVEFEKYLDKGYYPFFLHTSEMSYSQRVERLVRAVIDIDIPAVAKIEYETQLKLKKLLVLLADHVPYVPNITSLSRDIAVSRNQLMRFFSLLNEGAVLRMLSDPTSQPKAAAKPEKILFDNPSVIHALGIRNKVGTIRESFAASMLSMCGKLSAPKYGDFLLDKTCLFEVGGKGKGFDQIADQPNSYVLADDLEYGVANKIPLWMLGFIY